MAFLCLLELELHLPENGDLKGKRRELGSLKASLQRRFGAAVAETEHHDLWQRSTLEIALVGRERRSARRDGRRAPAIRRRPFGGLDPMAAHRDRHQRAAGGMSGGER